MFSSILIANRGEIACRIIRTCQRLGIWTVAVYSQADAASLHVRLADQAVCIGAAKAADSYLNAQAIITAARQTGAQAIHPGYGFLSERLDLIDACTAANIVFIGPHREAIDVMGSKIDSKRIARQAGVACIPGYDGHDQRLERLVAESQRIGFPLLIKASAGGGGKGMRRVEALHALESQLLAARAEAQAAFGNSDVLLERCILRARHIEVQLLGDQHGNLVHLFERECSIQRHYQKLIEESPANHLEDATRQHLFDAALALGRAIHYDNVGTIEFVLDADKANTPYFLEVNTRLQVEHPVTEATTGLDLVEWQIRAAAGERLTFTQHGVQQNGWAIEARINAESPAQGFAPSFGTVHDVVAPALAGVRLDTGVASGSEVTPHYDALIAKVIASGSDRATAQKRLIQALRTLYISGVHTTQALLLDILASQAFTQTLTTDHLDKQWPQGWQTPPQRMREARAIAAAAWLHQRLPQSDTPMARLVSWRLTAPADDGKHCHIEVDDGETITPLTLGLSGRRAWWEDAGVLQQADYLDSGVWVANAQTHWHTRCMKDTVALWCLGWSHTLRIYPRARLANSADTPAASGDSIVADIPGILTQLLVAPGDTVTAGSPVAVLEAMKLFHTLHAPRDGVVHALPVAIGATVAKNTTLVELVP